jgi:hypothetical protein
VIAQLLGFDGQRVFAGLTAQTLMTLISREEWLFSRT